MNAGASEFVPGGGGGIAAPPEDALASLSLGAAAPAEPSAAPAQRP